MHDFTELKKSVYQGNMLLQKYNLVIHTWGNISQRSKCGKFYAIKPSGVSYEKMTPQDIVVLDLEGNVIEGKLNPSSDTPTHTILYNKWPKINAICHTHSPFGVTWASTGENIPCFSTTHADNFYGDIFTTRELSPEEIQGEYEANTGHVIVETYEKNNLDPIASNAVLVKSHGPFLWTNKDAIEVANLALTLEEVAKIAYHTKVLNP